MLSTTTTHQPPSILPLPQAFFASSESALLQKLSLDETQHHHRDRDLCRQAIMGPERSGKSSLLLQFALAQAQHFLRQQTTSETDYKLWLLTPLSQKTFQSFTPCLPLTYENSGLDAVDVSNTGWNTPPNILDLVEIKYIPSYAHLQALLVSLVSDITNPSTTPSLILLDDFHSFFSATDNSATHVSKTLALLHSTSIPFILTFSPPKVLLPLSSISSEQQPSSSSAKSRQRIALLEIVEKWTDRVLEIKKESDPLVFTISPRPPIMERIASFQPALTRSQRNHNSSNIQCKYRIDSQHHVIEFLDIIP